MKTFLFKACFIAAAAQLFLTGCGDETRTVRHYIYLSDDMCTFKAAENSAVSIKVETFPDEWTFERTGDWFTAEKDGQYLKISVTDNDLDTERTGKVDITAGDAKASITVRQLPDDSMKARFRSLDYLHSSVISPSGKYAGGYYSTGDENTGLSLANIVFVDLETDEVTEFGPYPESLMLLTSVICITDQGQMYGVDGNGGIKVFDVHERNYAIVEAQGFDSSSLGVQNVTSDGRTWVGFISSGESLKPIICTDGIGEELPLPDKNYRDEPFVPSAAARGISHDGSIIYGTTWDNRDYGMIWWDKDRKVRYVGEDVRKITPIQRPDGAGGTYPYNMVDGMISWSGQYNVSPNGKYIAGTYRKEILESQTTGAVGESFEAAFFNTETQETKIFPEFGDASGMAVTDDGIGFVGNPSFNTSTGYVVNVETGESLGTIQQWALATYGIHLPYSGYMVYVPAGNEILWGATLRVTALGTYEAPNWYLAPPIK